ncbi:MAG: PDZ domain-containing protein [Bacteroidales bacterium]|nr:PDZ domain-containing protein [Bacteroidales bacterium]
MKKLKYFITGVLILSSFYLDINAQILNENTLKIARTLGLIDAFYVDTVNLNSLTEKVIIDLLRSLDPHSTYISAKDVKEMNEQLIGNFEGIGIQFNILHDTVIVIEPIKNSPSERVGLKAGDRIIKINDENVIGIGISTTGVKNRLMGPKGTKVNVTVFRPGTKAIYDFTITRDKIPINSMDAAYMLNNETAYFKFNKFSATTEKEFLDGLNSLNTKTLKNVIIDLRGNPGGYMIAAVALANQFLEGEKLVVYMEGRKTQREDFKSNGKGLLTKTNLVVLTDETSASASEIFAGAIQDWDRGIIAGRRTFGKGLVQNSFPLNDGSQIRLTIARYYTPTGRSIQSPYGEGYAKYIENYLKRFKNGERFNTDNIKLPDSLKCYTLVNKRTVYGGGGIMPDVFISADTSWVTDYYIDLRSKEIFNSFILEYTDKNRNKILSEYKDLEDFRNRFEFSNEDIAWFIKMGIDAGVKYNDYQFNISKKEIQKILKALVANTFWQSNGYFMIINENDNEINRILNLFYDPNEYIKILGY